MLENIDPASASGKMKVARKPRLVRCLDPFVLRKLRRYGAMTVHQLSDLIYIGVTPKARLRIAARLGASPSQRSAIRRALARLCRAQHVEVLAARNTGRCKRYQLSVNGRRVALLRR